MLRLLVPEAISSGVIVSLLQGDGVLQAGEQCVCVGGGGGGGEGRGGWMKGRWRGVAGRKDTQGGRGAWPVIAMLVLLVFGAFQLESDYN